MLWDHVPHTCHKYLYSKKAARREYLKISRSRKRTRKKLRITVGKHLKYVEAGTRQVEGFRRLAPMFSFSWLVDRLGTASP